MGRRGVGRSGRLVPGAAIVAAAALGLGGCDRPALAVPTAAGVSGYYQYAGGTLSVEMSGNVAEITVQQPEDQLRRGGELWAEVGPYIVLFTAETRDLFDDWPGLAGVRVVTTTPWGEEVARAFLRRDTLNDVTWRRALNIAGHARREGTEQPSRLEALVEWGEDHTEYRYSPEYTSE